MNKKKKILLIISTFFILLTIALLIPSLRSIIIMNISTRIEYLNSPIWRDDIKIHFPKNNDSAYDWNKSTYLFNADYYGKYIEDDVEMSIYYNFANFNKMLGSSEIFNVDSPLYSSFYGAYYIKKHTNGNYGYNVDGIDLDEIEQAFRYDYLMLVLRDFDLYHYTFIPQEYIIENIDDDTIRIDTIISTNGVCHQYIQYQQSYLQYGNPPKQTNINFDLITMYARTYITYLEDEDATIMYYIMSPNIDVIDDWDKYIYSQQSIILH